jgi:hypothetical protein
MSSARKMYMSLSKIVVGDQVSHDSAMQHRFASLSDASDVRLA